MVAEKELPFNNDSILDIQRDEVSAEKLRELAEEVPTDGVSVCVRQLDEPTNRGGYLFHYRPSDSGIELVFFPFEVENRELFDNWDDFGRFVKHSIGSEYDEEMYRRSLHIVTRVEG